MLKTVSVSSLTANPFRELDDYPIDRDKIDALKESIESTGFWGTIVARKKGSKYEIAFGHHRMTALQELGTKRCEVIVRDLSNEDMVQMMARENLEEWGTSAYIEAQTVESTIRAYGNGEIELPRKLSKDTNKGAVRDAGIHASPRTQRLYTKEAVASFLGWTDKNDKPNHACRVAFEMIDAFDAKVVTRKQLRGVKRDVAREIVTKAMGLKREQERIAKQKAKEAKRAEEIAEQEQDAKKKRAFKSAAARRAAEAKQAEESATATAKEFAKDAVKQTKAGNWSQRDVREAGAEVKASLHSKRAQRFNDASQHLAGLTRTVSKTLNKTDQNFDGLSKLLSMDCGLTGEDISNLKKEVDALAKRASRFSGELAKWNPPVVADTVDSQLRIVG